MTGSSKKYYLIEYEHGAGQAYSVSEEIYTDLDSARSEAQIMFSPYLSPHLREFTSLEAAQLYQSRNIIYRPFSW